LSSKTLTNPKICAKIENMKKFTHIDTPFICAVCGADVPPLGYTARNHCNRCLCSLHLDVNPGDRLSDCGGVLRPVAVEPHARKPGVMQIVHKCAKCGKFRRNIVARDDDYDAVLAVMSKKVFTKTP
jgi:DNA-directed RNA polymerase subunit RPC12/RpoP